MDLVFDIGGTYLRVAESESSSDRIGVVQRFDTPNFFETENLQDAVETLADFVVETADKAARERGVDRVCIGFPGPVDAQGNILAAPTVWGRQAELKIPFRNILLDRRSHWRIHVINDVAAAGYAYVEESCRDFLIATVGSGVGSKLFLDGRPVTGSNMRGGEIGHLKVDFAADAAMCDCGEQGHIGAVSSGRGVLRWVRRQAVEQPDLFLHSVLRELCSGDAARINSDKIVAAFRAQDTWVCDMVKFCTRPFAQSLAAIHLHCGVERFIVIGGFAQALGESYAILLAESASEMAWRNNFDWRNGIVLTGENENPGLQGAHRYLCEWASAPRAGSDRLAP